MPVEYSAPKVVDSKSANSIRMTGMQIIMKDDAAELQKVRFEFTAYDQDGLPIGRKKLSKTIAEISKSHKPEFVAAYAAIKTVAYSLMESEGIYPAGSIT